ncbi:MAG: nucleoside triphosphate pyrophosphohydrolase [Bacteroidales bacterium]|nr:nucleoside triphosphate pyrophosphohydrolase [Bacteroidales bacterium]
MTKDTLEALERFDEILRRLRKECPWDKKQTWDSLRTNTIEETYELADALASHADDEVRKELGDVFLHIAFYSLIAEEQGKFSLADVVNSLCDKLVYRHPHVFGNVTAETSDEVTSNWEKLKLKEKDGNKTVLGGVPGSLPAMIKAYRVQGKAKGVGFDWDDANGAWDKLHEELDEFKAEVDKGDADAMEAELGDVLFSVINVARMHHINPENALERTNRKFISRFNYLESKTIAQGIDLRSMTLAEMDKYWDEAKALEKSNKTKQK